MSTQPEVSSVLEQRSIDYVPASERHGKPRHLFTIWFSSNVQINALVTGALSVVLGLDLTWAIISILIGNLVGGLFMAYHSIQGPRLGVPQMIQTRAQFGFFGTLLPLIVVLFMYLGFAVEGGILAGNAIAQWTHLPKVLAIILFQIVLLLIALFGYRLIHLTSRVVSVISAVVFVALFAILLTHLPQAPAAEEPVVTFGTVLLVISIFVSWQITWAPYVSDYSRYLPESTPPVRTFLWTYIGSALGASFAMIIGAFAAIIGGKAFEADPVGFLGGQFPAISALLVVALVLSTVPAGAEGFYGAFLTAISGFSTEGSKASTPRLRAVCLIVFGVISTVLAILLAGASILSTFQNITLLVLYLLVPWTAINLTDFYLVRRGHYEISELFKRDGLYGRFTTGAVVIYLLAIAVQVPFISSGLYVGPFASALGGADISWIIGLILPSIAYYLYARVRQTRTVGRPDH